MHGLRLPSTGGVLIKEADLLDMVFLSHPRSHALQHAPSTDEEDRFRNLLRQTGATFWTRKQDWFDVQVGLRESTEEEKKVVVYGWPADGVCFRLVKCVPRNPPLASKKQHPQACCSRVSLIRKPAGSWAGVRALKTALCGQLLERSGQQLARCLAGSTEQVLYERVTERR